MPARNRKGRFVKGGSRKRSRRRSTAAAPKRRRATYRSAAAPRRRRRSSSSGSGGVGVLQVAGAGIALGYLASGNVDDNGKQVGAIEPGPLTKYVAKVPGFKTFGGPAVLGAACFLVDRYLYKSKWLKGAGYAGIALAATHVGVQQGGTAKGFEWLGDLRQDPRRLHDADELGSLYLAGASDDINSEERSYAMGYADAAREAAEELGATSNAFNDLASMGDADDDLGDVDDELGASDEDELGDADDDLGAADDGPGDGELGDADDE